MSNSFESLSSETRNLGGRPSIYTTDLTTQICARLASGESLRSICRDDAMPHISTVLLWVVSGKEEHRGFFEQYAQARQAQGYAIADKTLEVASLVGHGSLDPQSAKVIIDTYKWTAERNAPKAYGVSSKVDHTSSDGSMSPPKTLADFYADSGDK